jgi:hypothetical protein
MLQRVHSRPLEGGRISALSASRYNLMFGVCCTCRPAPDVLQLYKAHVRAIAEELRQPDLPAYCLRVTAQDRMPDGSSSSSSTKAGTANSALQGASRCGWQYIVFDSPAVYAVQLCLGNSVGVGGVIACSRW